MNEVSQGSDHKYQLYDNEKHDEEMGGINDIMYIFLGEK